jgi:membrane fusion protein
MFKGFVMSLSKKPESSIHSDQSQAAQKTYTRDESEKHDSGKKKNNTDTSKRDSPQAGRVKKAPLFREEALQAQNTRLDGNVFISHSLSYRNFAIFYTLICLLIVSFLYFGTYTRKINVTGLIEPESGLSKVYPTNSGNISELLVAEGDAVKKGEPLVKVIMDSISDAGEYGFEQIASEINQSIERLSAQRKKQIEDYVLEKKRLRLEIDSSNELLISLLKQKSQLSRKDEIIKNKLDSLEILQKKGSLSLIDYNNEKIDALDNTLTLNKIDTSISEAMHTLSASRLSLEKLPLNHAVTLDDIDQKISDMRRQLTEANMHHAYTIVSPVDGYVSALTYRNGDNISPNYPLLSIMPERSKMQAKIYLPASSISFIHEGQAINIQYQALPVQRFGTYPGKIVHVSTTPVNPKDFQTSPFTFDQPMYLVTAEVNDQNIELENSTFPIVAGMAINISLLAEEQTILEWLLDPFWEIKGRIQ